jgi:hypothetical protein
MAQAGLRCRFMWHRRRLLHAWSGAALHHVDARMAVVVVGPHDTEKTAAVVGASINVTQEVSGGERRAIGAEQQRETAKWRCQFHPRTDHRYRGGSEQTAAGEVFGHSSKQFLFEKKNQKTFHSCGQNLIGQFELCAGRNA